MTYEKYEKCKTQGMVKNFQKIRCIHCKNNCSINEVTTKMKVKKVVKHTVYWSCEDYKEEVQTVLKTDKIIGEINDCYNNNEGICFFDGKPCHYPKGKECSNEN